jgi:CHAT domain-containing protein/Flp pilus assembly protein TadD
MLFVCLFMCGFIACLYSEVQAQNIPKNANKTDKKGFRQGTWTIAYNKEWKETVTKDSISFYRIINYKDDKPVGKVYDHYCSGKVQMEAMLLQDRPEEVMDGIAIWYREDGTKETERTFKAGKQESEKSFDAEGKEINYTWQEVYDEGNKYYNEGNYAKAVQLYEYALPLAEKEFTKNSKQYATTLNDIGISYSSQGKYAQAEPLYIEAKNIFAKVLGKEHINYATSCDNLANLYYNQGKYAQAELLYIEVKDICVKVLGKEHPAYATSCNNIANLYGVQGKYAQAEALYIEAKNIREKILGKESADYAKVCNNLGLFYCNQGKYSKAELLYIEAKDICVKVLGKENIDYATSCSSIANLYGMQGKYAQAEALYIEAKNIRAKVLGKAHPDYATSCNNLAVLYCNQGKYAQAELLYIEDKNIQEKILGKEHPNYATSCNNLALLYDSQGKYAQAEPLYIEAKNILAKVVGKEHPAYATFCNNLASLYDSQGKYAEAEPLYIEAKNIKEKILGKEHPAYATSCHNLALLYDSQGKYAQAETFYNQANQAYLAQINNNFSTLSEKEKGVFYNTFAFNFEIFNSFALRRYKENKSLAGAVYNNTLATKALLFDANNKMRERIMQSNDEKLKTLFQFWKDKKEYLSKVYAMSLADRQKQGIEVSKLETETNEIEKQLASQSELFAKATDKTRYTWQDVQKKLKVGEVAIEIIRTQIYDKKWTDSIRYMALLVTPTSSYPEMIILPNGNELEEKYAKNYQNSIKFKKQDKYSYTQYWKPVGEKLQGVKKVYLSVDGVYNSLSMNTLFNTATGKYIGEELEIQIVSNTKDMINLQANQKINNAKTNVVLVGFPAYNKSPLTPKGGTELEKGVKVDSTQRFFNGEDITELVGTKIEVENLQNILQKNNIKIQSYTEEKASESLIKQLDSPSILHIATHGFFMKDVEKEQKDERGFMGMESKKIFENPLLRSGLLFANAKNALQDGSDGVLTAYEAMNLNLDNTDLVVLSACETGLGEVRNGEGVYGLQRAFQQAGAKTVLMSLWTVSDNATQELMTLFYENLIVKQQSKRLAFQNAQQTLKEKYKDPYYWGAFVMVGE